MCNHDALALIQEKAGQNRSKKYYCFVCGKIMPPKIFYGQNVLDMRFIPIEMVKKRFS